jgi:O-acetyl-ADP-ribose deacetylase (regulator of RNase III)
MHSEGGGIDGAIHSAAGKDLYAECSTLGGAETGQTKITRGYNLPAKYVLHTVGPVGRDPQKLKSCYSTVLQLVKKHKIKTVAICGISTGIYGYPLYAASHVALKTVREWLEDKDNRKKVDVIIMCTYLDKEMVCYQKLMNYYFPPPGKNTADVESIYNKAFNEYDPAADADRLLQDEQAEKALKKKRKEEARQREEQWKSMQQQLKAKQDNDNNKHNSDDTKDKVDDKKDADDDKKDKKDDADDNNTDDKDNKEDKDSKDTEEKKTDGSAAENTTAETAASSESNSNTQTDAKEDDSKEQ